MITVRWAHTRNQAQSRALIALVVLVAVGVVEVNVLDLELDRMLGRLARREGEG